MPGGIPEGADYFTVPLKHGVKYAMLVAGRWVIVVNSEASHSLFRRRGMFNQYKLLDGVFVYTASGEAIPVVGTGLVGGLPNCLHVPTLEKDLLSVPHMDVAMKWRTTFEGGHALLMIVTRGLTSSMGLLTVMLCSMLYRLNNSWVRTLTRRRWRCLSFTNKRCRNNRETCIRRCRGLQDAGRYTGRSGLLYRTSEARSQICDAGSWPMGYSSQLRSQS